MINCDYKCSKEISRIIYYQNVKSIMFRYRNFRGIEQQFDKIVTHEIIRKLNSISSESFSLNLVPHLENSTISVQEQIVTLGSARASPQVENDSLNIFWQTYYKIKEEIK